MQLLSVSLAEIENDLVDYFATTFHVAPSTLPPATDVRKMFNFSGPAWAQLADTLSSKDWMRHLGVILGQGDMTNISTLEQIAFLIFKRMQHVVTPAQPVQVAPLAPMMKASRQTAAPPPAAAQKKGRRNQ